MSSIKNEQGPQVRQEEGAVLLAELLSTKGETNRYKHADRHRQSNRQRCL